MNIFHTIITRPLGILLMWLYELIGSYGLTIILFTVAFRLIMFPLQLKSKRSTLKMTKIQPQVQAIQKKYQNNPQKMNEEIQKLYRSENISMMSGCLPMLLTLPLMICLYYAVTRPLTFMMGLGEDTILQIAETLDFTITSMYTDQIPLANLITQHFDEVKHISPLIVPMDFTFLGMDLSLTPSISNPSLLWIIPLLSGGSALFSSWFSMRRNPAQQQVNGSMKMMLYFMPLMSVYFAFILPAGVGVYWIVGNVMMVVQEAVLTAYLNWQEKRHPQPETKPKKGAK